MAVALENAPDLQHIDNVIKFRLIKPPTQKAKVKRVNGRVNAIKDMEDIEKAKQFFLNQNDYYHNASNLRNYCLFVVCLNCARRISDTLEFKIGDVLDINGRVKDYIIVKETKTQKRSKIFFNENVKQAISLYLSARKKFKYSDPLFISREVKNKAPKAIDRRQAYNIFKKMADEIGLTEKGIKIGTHSPRKTFVYQNLKAHPNSPMYLSTLQRALNHSSAMTTLIYADIGDEEMEDLYLKNPL